MAFLARPTIRMTTGFDALGFLSTDVEEERRVLREAHSTAFANVECLAAQAIAELKTVNGEAQHGYLIGVAYWMRCIESCQGAVLLIERGLPTAPFPLMRTAFECVFMACALWRKPSLVAKLQEGHDSERVKQAKAMVAAGAAGRVAPGRLLELESVAAEVPPAGPGLTAWEAAGAADLTFEYQTAYRGFGIAGAHASPRSLDAFAEEQADGSIDLHFGPDDRHTAWLLGLVATCLTCGIQRHREIRAEA